MPWELQENHPECSAAKPWAVVDKQTRERMGCHPTEEAAKRQQAALYANEGRGADSMELKAFDVAVKMTPDESHDSGNGQFEAILSAPTLDRDGEVVDHKAFDPLPAVLPVHAFHDFTMPVGKGRPFYDGDVLKIEGTFASTARAQEIRTLVTEGVVSSMSVGFMAAERDQKDGVAHIIKGELLEGSFVSIPSNREAAVLAAKSANWAKHLDPNSLSGRQALVQSAYSRQNIRGYVLDVYDGFCIVSPDYSEAGDFLRVDYTIDGDTVTFGEATPVALDVQIRDKGARSNVTVKVGARNSRSDSDRIQAVHDAACELGAACAKSAEPQVSVSEQPPEQAPGDTKSPGATPAGSPLALHEAAAYAAAAQVQLLTMKVKP